MDPVVAIILFLLAVTPLVSAVDFAFVRRLARQKPSRLWYLGFAFPVALLVTAAATQARVIFPFALLLGGGVGVSWLVRRARVR
jgi:hypothetical protein